MEIDAGAPLELSRSRCIAPERQTLEFPEGGLERVYELGQFRFAVRGTCNREEHDLLSGCAPNDDLTASILCVAEQAFTYSFYPIERVLAQRPFRLIEAGLLGAGHIRPTRRKSRHLSQGGARNQTGCKSCLD